MDLTAPRRTGSARPRPNTDIVEARLRKGLSREELGRLVGISAKQIGLIERGVARLPRESTVADIAKQLDMDAVDVSPPRTRLTAQLQKQAARAATIAARAEHDEAVPA